MTRFPFDSCGNEKEGEKNLNEKRKEKRVEKERRLCCTFHTKDGGDSFVNDGADVKGVTILAADFSSKQRGYAAVVTNL